MTVNLATALIKSTGSTTSRSFGARAADIINVKDYGALGDSSHNDGPNIQAAFDAAFGSAASPHDNANKFQNVPVYFPAGSYKVGAPLYLTNVYGGWIFGAGSLCTRLEYSGAYSGNTLIANGITPLLMLNGFSNGKIEGLNLSMANNSSTCIYIFTSSASPGPNTTTAITFNDLLIDTCTAGILAYQSQNGTCSECIYSNVSFTICTYGLRIVDQNALNHCVYGGGASSCAEGYSQVGGNISPICDASLAGNAIDFRCHGGEPVSIIGGRSEGTYPSSNTACIYSDDTQVHVSGFGLNSAGAGGQTMVDVSAGGTAVLDACSFNPGTSGGTGTIASLGGNGKVIMDGLFSGSTTSVITGSAGSKLYLRGCSFANASVIAGYTGTVGQNI